MPGCRTRIPSRVDVLVVGAGPAGAAAAFWLAERGHSVLAVDKKVFPREKTCGDGLTPRAVRQLVTWGSADPLRDFHRYDGLRSIAHGITLELAWPEHPDFPSYGYVVRRRDLDEMVADQAVKAGATVWQGAEAVAPLVEDGLVTGAVIARKDSGDHRGRSGRSTWWWPTAPTRGSAGRSAPRGTARTRWAWRFAAISPVRTTTSPGSSPTSTCATATATTCRATAGSSRSATAP